jgi:exosortase E/protease (VPEID-CTERM system)
MLLTDALSAGFNWLYPVRVFVVFIALWFAWPLLKLGKFKPRWEGFVAGLLVAVLWVWLSPADPEFDANFSTNLLDIPPLWSTLWLIFRLIGATITVPIAEELAFRGYMLCKLTKVEIITRGSLPISIIAVAISSLAFGALHGAWVAGTVAGVIYALVRLRSNTVSDAILAHGLTNGLLFAYASIGGQWSLL